MHRGKYIYGFSIKKQAFYRGYLPGMMCLVLVCVGIVSTGTPVTYASGPGGDVSDPVVRAVDIAKPAVVRIITQIVGQLTVNFSAGRSVTFPLTPQNGFNGYPIDLSGSGAFISAHGDLLTADHVVNPAKTDLDQFLDTNQQVDQDVANYINQNLRPAHPVTPDVVGQELASGQLQSTTQYQRPVSQIYLSTDFSGPLSAANFQDVPASQFARVDTIKEQSAVNQRDVAIIHVSGMDNMPMLQLGSFASVQQQDQLTILGFPGNADVGTSATNLLTTSINHVSVSALKTTDAGAPVIQVDGNVQHGDSGGPALNSSGQEVGVVSFGVTDNSGSTSFLQASDSAKQLIQTAGIDTTPSPLQQAWAKALTDYGANIPGHWHQSMREFQQIATQYPAFKAATPFLQYATQQAQTETQTQESTSPGNGAPTNGLGGVSPLFIILGGVVVLIVLVGAGLLISSRRKPATATAGYGAVPTPGYNGFPGQGYGAFPPQFPNSPPPSTPPGPPSSFAHPAGYAGQTPHQQPQYGGVFTPPAYQPQRAQPAPTQQSYLPASSMPPASNGNMTAFGAPVPVTPPQAPNAADSTLVAGPGNAASQWRSWPCGHFNREDARFCGICGERAPSAPVVRRVEQ